MKRTFTPNIRIIAVTIVIIGLLSLFGFRYADDPIVTKIANQLGLFNDKCKLQKVYVHTNKDIYITGESIWLKGYLLNAYNLLPENSSNEIFVDLVNKDNAIIKSIILKNRNGFSLGDIELDDSIPDGNYQLVAYSNWMKNFDDDFFFSKTIQVKSPKYGNYVTSSTLKEIEEYNQSLIKADEIKTISFFPEGGTLVAGLECRVAFKAINSLGYGVDVAGEIFDDQNTRVGHFETKHLGMGSFSITPQLNRKYTAKVIFSNGKTEKFNLPSITPQGYTMMVNALAGDKIRLAIQSNITDQGDDKTKEIIIVGQSRGQIKYLSKGILTGKPLNSAIPKKLFPAGIAQITLFNGRGEPLCERLVFIQPKEADSNELLKVESKTEGDEIVYQIRLNQPDGKPQTGNISLSVYESLNNSEIQKWKENILTNLLLTSDIKGRIERPLDYFDSSNPSGNLNLDYIMLTNGWRRFVWKDVIAGYSPIFLFLPSEGITEEIRVSSNLPFSFDVTDKLHPGSLNDKFDAKKIRENTRIAAKNRVGGNSSVSGNVHYIDPIKTSGYSNMVQYMNGRFAGVSVSGNGITIRGAASINSGTDPLILLDGSSISFSNLNTIVPKEVATIEILKGSDASLYGVRGANGVIILTMRKGSENINNLPANSEPAVERIIGFHKAREFYVPSYDTWESKPTASNVPRAIAWKPSIVLDSTGMAVVRVKNKLNLEKYTTSIEGMSSNGCVLNYSAGN